ncbi:hypothetical protein MP228_012766 [Amoeboaphelidium protococcarum]|nr:hypothetical protein MP228_012766 [Amoeboaphelidium protococcarum]
MVVQSSSKQSEKDRLPTVIKLEEVAVLSSVSVYLRLLWTPQVLYSREYLSVLTFILMALQKMTMLLCQLLQLVDTTLYDYLRPVDFLQLTLAGKKCQEIILSQRQLVRQSYWKYYGPVLAMYRCKFHPYLQLKTVDDYLLFMHKDLEYDQVLHQNSLNWCSPQNESSVKEWNLVIRHRFSVDDRYVPFEKRRFSEWNQYYERDYYENRPNREEPLASSQMDFLITIFRQCALHRSFYAQVDLEQKRFHMRFWRYGYIYDALRNAGLHALVKIFNDHYDNFSYRSPDPLEAFKQGVFGAICRYFDLGDCRLVLQRLADLFEMAPDFQVLLSYRRAARDLGLFDQLDQSKLLEESLVHLKEFHSCSYTSQKVDERGLERHRQCFKLPDGAQSELLKEISLEWVCNRLQQFDSIRTIEFGWIVVELLAAQDRSLITLQLKLVDKVKSGQIDEASCLLTAIASSLRVYATLKSTLNSELFQEYKGAVIQILMKLLDNCSAQSDHYVGWVSAAISLFKSMLVDSYQLILPRVIQTFDYVNSDQSNDVVFFNSKSSLMFMIIYQLEGKKSFAVFLQSLNAENACNYNERTLMLIALHCWGWEEQTCKLATKLLTLYRDNDDPQATASILNESCRVKSNCDSISQILVILHSVEQLQQISVHLESDVIEALRLGPEYHLSWIQGISRAASELKFPDNIIEIVKIANVNCGSIANAPECVQKKLAAVIESAILMPLDQRLSRFYFLDDLPYFVFKEDFIIKKYMSIWNNGGSNHDHSIVLEETEFICGYFSYVHSDKVPERDRKQLVTRFFDNLLGEFTIDQEEVIEILVNDYGYPDTLTIEDLF